MDFYLHAAYIYINVQVSAVKADFQYTGDGLQDEVCMLNKK